MRDVVVWKGLFPRRSGETNKQFVWALCLGRNEINVKKYLIGIAIIIIVVIITNIIFFLFMGVDILGLRYIWNDVGMKEIMVNLQLHGSYEVNTSRIRKSEHINENTPFTFFIQTGINNSTKERLLNMYDLELPNELLADIELYNENGCIILTFGRELKEVKYKFLNKTGVSANAKVVFCEEYQGDVMFAYFIAEKVSFHEETFYIMKGSKKVYWGEGRVGTVYAEELKRH